MSPDRNLRVLVVDDHDVVHWGFRLLLTEQPWVERCLTASSVEEALQMTRRYSPHVALVDLFLGEESGAELCEAIRRESPNTRVLLISGAGWISPQAAKAAGAAGFVSKDWPAHDVAMAVRMVGKGMTVFALRATLGARARGADSHGERRHQQGDRRAPLSLPAHCEGAHQRALSQAGSAQPRRGGAARGATGPDGLARLVEERSGPSSWGQPRLDETVCTLGVAVKEPDAYREDRVEASLAEVEVLQACDEELGPAGRHVLGVSPGRRFDHLRGAVDGGQAALPSRSHTSVAATPCPHPISSTRSSGRMSRLSTIDRSRSLTR
jgi:DNA-binding NarL/FixJ family response regulator